jgi:hypothetical protein
MQPDKMTTLDLFLLFFWNSKKRESMALIPIVRVTTQSQVLCILRDVVVCSDDSKQERFKFRYKSGNSGFESR